MKDQYFGDFGDYQKISLLKHLRDQNLNITVHWMKTSDDSSTDGKHIAYLKDSSKWGMYEPDVFKYLQEKIATQSRSLKHTERSPYTKGCVFVNRNIENQKTRRIMIENICRSSLIDIVFFDPDNGIEVSSMTKKNVHKYVLWNEIVDTYNSGKSLLIYQHFSRKNRGQFIKDKIIGLQNKLHANISALQVKHSVYFFVTRKNNTKAIDKAIKSYRATWGNFAILHQL